MVKILHPLGPISSRIELPPEVRVPLVHDAEPLQGQAALTTLVDSAAAAREALRSPLKFPPLAEGVVPGDQLAIVIDEAVPDALNILRGAIAAAEEAGIVPAAISVVAIDEDFCKLLRDELGDGVCVVVHDPEDPQNLALLGPERKKRTPAGESNRLRGRRSAPDRLRRLTGVAGCGVFDCLFPRMSDTETIGRLRTPTQRDTPARWRKRSGRRTKRAGCSA